MVFHAQRSAVAWSDQHGPSVLLVSLVITAVLACGGLGLESYVRAQGTLLGVRNYGFLLTGFNLLIVLLIAYGFSEILFGRFESADIAICTISFGLGAGIFAWSSGTEEVDVVTLLFTIATFGALSFLVKLLRAKVRHIGLFAISLIMLMLVENVTFVNQTMPSLLDAFQVQGKGLKFENVVKNQPFFRMRKEEFAEKRSFYFNYGPYIPYAFLASAVYKIPSAYMEPVYDSATGRTATYFFRLRNYYDLMRGDIEEGQRQQILGVTRPTLELVPRHVVQNQGGVWSFVLGTEVRAQQPPEEEANLIIPALDVAFGRMRVVQFSGDRIVIKVNSPEDAVLIYRDNYASGWSVRLDDQRAELLLIDRVNKAVAVPSGAHEVTFVYRPWLYQVAFALRLVALLIAGVACANMAVRRWRRTTRRRAVL